MTLESILNSFSILHILIHACGVVWVFLFVCFTLKSSFVIFVLKFMRKISGSCYLFEVLLQLPKIPQTTTTTKSHQKKPHPPKTKEKVSYSDLLWSLLAVCSATNSHFQILHNKEEVSKTLDRLGKKKKKKVPVSWKQVWIANWRHFRHKMLDEWL